MTALLEVKNLTKHFPIVGGVFRRTLSTVRAVDNISFTVRKGQTVGLVGESGCGKSTVGRTIIRLHEPTSGSVIFQGQDLASLSSGDLRLARKNLQFIFQDPFESLNPRHTVGKILQEPFIVHAVGSVAERLESVQWLLSKVGLPQDTFDRFPHELSGGQRQRVGIARAIALKPSLVICDEPVSALDVSVQSQILNLLLQLQDELKLSYIFIAHDLAVVKHVSDLIAVMYLGKIVEYAPADTLYHNPLHPYTRGLISAIPVPDPNAPRRRAALKGDVPTQGIFRGCRFNSRCPYANDKCLEREPELVAHGAESHLVACHFAGKL